MPAAPTPRQHEGSAESWFCRDPGLALLHQVIDAHSVQTLDLTGGAPELNPDFRRLVSAARALGLRVIDRCNLTILGEPGQETLAEFLAEQHVEIVASLPCYLEENVNKQRGDGVFQASLDGLRRLNALGYGLPLEVDAHGDAVDPAARYQLDPERGPVRDARHQPDSPSGAARLALAADRLPPTAQLAELRLALRGVLQAHLGSAPLKSWGLMSELARLGRD